MLGRTDLLFITKVIAMLYGQEQSQSYVGGQEEEKCSKTLGI
jgi:hypothetical protein